MGLLDNVVPMMSMAGHISVTTANPGSTWTPFTAQTCKQLTVSNQTGTTLEFRQGSRGVGFPVPTGAFYTFFGLVDASDLEVRRTDVSNTQVSVVGRWEN